MQQKNVGTNQLISIDNMEKKLDNNIDRLENDGSTDISHNKKKEEEQIRCGLALYSFDDEYEWYIEKI